MRKLAIVLIAVSVVGCKEEKEPVVTPVVGDSCTANQVGARKCDGSNLLECNGKTYAVLKDCATTGEICVGNLSILSAACEVEVEPANEFEECTGTGQGNCVSGLACGTTQVNMFKADYSDWCKGDCCVTNCAADAAVCGTDRYCEPGTVGGQAFMGQASCYPVQPRDGICLFNNDGCEGDLECTTVVSPYNGIVPQCKLLCDGSEVDTDPESCAGDTCIQAPRFFGVETQEDTKGDAVPCAVAGEPDKACTANENYTCMEVTMEDDAVETVCARRPGICGTIAPPAPDFANRAALEAYINVDTNLCHDLMSDQYCGKFVAAGAIGTPVTEFECAATNYLGRYTDPPACNNSEDAPSCFGLGECATFDGSVYECAIPVNVCIPFCTPADGIDDDMDCGTGYTCQPPTYTDGAGNSGWAIQRGPADAQGRLPAILCDTASGGPSNCDTTKGFACNTTDFGDYQVCAEIRKICVAD